MSRRRRRTKEERLHFESKSNFRCWYCGIHIYPGVASLDHVVPLDRGGKDHESNIVACCIGCNILKGNKTLEEFRDIGIEFSPHLVSYLRLHGVYHLLERRRRKLKFYGDSL